MNVILGQFYPTSSTVEKIDARIKILCTILYIAAVFLSDSFISFGICTLFFVFTSIMTKLPFNMILKGMRGMVFILVFTVVMNLLFNQNGNSIIKYGFINITDIAVITTAKICIRLILLILFSSILTLTTKPVALTSAIEDLLSPLKIFKLPVSELAMIMGIALRFIPTLCDEMEKIKKAQEARGASFSDGNIIRRIKSLIPVIIPLFVSAFRRADELAMAMDSRCYNADIKRTRLNNPKICVKDYIALFGCIILIMLIVILEYVV